MSALFTNDELVIVEAFKELSPWKGSAKDKCEKWQSLLSNLCHINQMTVIPQLKFPSNPMELLLPSRHSVEPPTIFLKILSAQDLLFHFYCFREEWCGREVDHNKAVEYSVGLFYSVWPKKINTVIICPKAKYVKQIVSGLQEATIRHPKYKIKAEQLCKDHFDIPKGKSIHYPGQLHPELN